MKHPGEFDWLSGIGRRNDVGNGLECTDRDRQPLLENDGQQVFGIFAFDFPRINSQVQGGDNFLNGIRVASRVRIDK